MGASRYETVHNEYSAMGAEYGATAKEMSDIESLAQQKKSLTKRSYGDYGNGRDFYQEQLSELRKNQKAAPDATDDLIRQARSSQLLRLASMRGRASSFLTGTSAVGKPQGV